MALRTIFTRQAWKGCKEAYLKYWNTHYAPSWELHKEWLTFYPTAFAALYFLIYAPIMGIQRDFERLPPAEQAERQVAKELNCLTPRVFDRIDEIIENQAADRTDTLSRLEARHIAITEDAIIYERKMN